MIVLNGFLEITFSLVSFAGVLVVTSNRRELIPIKVISKSRSKGILGRIG